MKASICLAAAAATLAHAHYNFNRLIVGGKMTGEWENVRVIKGKYSHGPVENVLSTDIRCQQESPTATAKAVNVSAGDTVGFNVDSYIGHTGPLSFWLAKAPSGESAESWSGEGPYWFKIYEDHAQFPSSGPVWPNANAKEVSVKIPSCISPGDYLLRVEHIGLHAASNTNGAQFYISCAPLVISGGSGTASPKMVSFPGAYSPTDPGIKFQLYWPVPTSYINPGPAPLQC